MTAVFTTIIAKFASDKFIPRSRYSVKKRLLIVVPAAMLLEVFILFLVIYFINP